MSNPVNHISKLKIALISLGYAQESTKNVYVQDAFFKYMTVCQAGSNPLMPYDLDLLPKEIKSQLGSDEPTPPTPSVFETMLVTPASLDVSISSVSELEIDWGDGTIQTVKSGDDLTFVDFGITCNKYSHTYTDSFEDKVISIKHLDGKSPIQFLSSIYLKTVQRWYSEGYQPVRFFNADYNVDYDLSFYGLGLLLEAVPNTAPPKTTNLGGLLSKTNVFNQDISGWDISNVTNLTFMFAEAKAFNQDISGWDVSNVTSMHGMFSDTVVFNQDISGWDVSNVTTMNGMFYNAAAFNQDISQWCVSNITSEPGNFSEGALLAAENKPVWGTCPVG